MPPLIPIVCKMMLVTNSITYMIHRIPVVTNRLPFAITHNTIDKPIDPIRPIFILPGGMHGAMHTCKTRVIVYVNDIARVDKQILRCIIMHRTGMIVILINMVGTVVGLICIIIRVYHYSCYEPCGE